MGFYPIPPGTFKIVAASVPCTEYSIAKTTAPREYYKADKLVLRVLDAVKFLKPKIWWVENPRHGHLRNRAMMRDIPFVDIDYCQFSDWGYQKPTRFWGSPNLGELKHRKCPGRACKYVVEMEGGFHHKERLGGDSIHFNSTLKGRIPPKVVDYLIRDGEYAPSLVPKSKLIVQQK